MTGISRLEAGVYDLRKYHSVLTPLFLLFMDSRCHGNDAMWDSSGTAPLAGLFNGGGYRARLTSSAQRNGGVSSIISDRA